MDAHDDATNETSGNDGKQFETKDAVMKKNAKSYALMEELVCDKTIEFLKLVYIRTIKEPILRSTLIE